MWVHSLSVLKYIRDVSETLSWGISMHPEITALHFVVNINSTLLIIVHLSFISRSLV